MMLYSGDELYDDEITSPTERLYLGSAAPAEDRLAAYDNLVEVHDAALDWIDNLTEQRNSLLGALLNMLYYYETGRQDNPEIKLARAAVAGVLGEDFDTTKAIINLS